MLLSFIAIYFGFSILAIQRVAEKQYDGRQSLQEQQQVQLDEQKLCRQTVNGRNCWIWEEIHQVLEAKEFFQFHLEGGHFVPILQYFFGDGEQLTRVYALLDHQFTKRKEGRWEKQRSSSKV